jgi:hypothetical protein
MTSRAEPFLDRSWRTLSDHVRQAKAGLALPLTLLVGAGIHNLHSASFAFGIDPEQAQS